MDATIVEESGSHLLLAQGGRFVVVERRNNRIYNCHNSKRDGIAADNLSAIGEVVDENDWVDEAAARQAFNEVSSRGADLAKHMR